jgi:site-specific DNA-methyltransferase (adenine-specific)
VRKAIAERLRLGDCIELLKDVPAGSVDMALIDPPYGVTNCAWDTPLPLPEMWAGLKRVCKPNAAMLFFAQCPFDKVLGVSNIKQLRYEWFWDKRRVTGFYKIKTSPLRRVENILVFYDTTPKYNPQMTEGKPYSKRQRAYPSQKCYHITQRCDTESDGQRYPVNILEFSSITGDRDVERINPTQKPVPLCEYLIKTYTDPGDTVLDICAGSGTAAVAAVNTGRDFIAFEKDPGYHAAAARRIEDAMRESERSLFFAGFPNIEPEERASA